MPSPSADSKFVLSIPKIFKQTQFFNHTQNVFVILKSGILLHKLDYLSIVKTFWVYFKKLSLLKNLSILKENFGSADGLGNTYLPVFDVESSQKHWQLGAGFPVVLVGTLWLKFV